MVPLTFVFCYGDVQKIAGRNDRAISNALEAMAQAMQNQNQNNVGGDVKFCYLEKFQRNKPPTFKGKYDPDGAQEWLKVIEKIFRVMNFSEEQKVSFGTYILVGEADDWWMSACRVLENIVEEITWAVLSRKFLRKYFPEDVCAKKEIEFLQLMQGNMSVTEYVAKFEELAKFYPYYAAETVEFLKCVKFENGLCTEIKRAIGYQQIRMFLELVNGCRIYKEDTKTHFKMMSEKRGKQHNRGKQYNAPVDKGKKKAREGKKPSGGVASTGITCFKCGETGQRVSECTKDSWKYFKCGKA